MELIDANRLSVIESIIESIEDLWFEKTGVEKYTVYSAIELSDKLEKKLLTHLEKKLDKKIVLEKEIDQSLIAGLKLKKGSIYYDFSIDGNLKKLYETLSEGSIEGSIIQEN
jgi:F-type H+-transporting ATPase subunit delta